MAFPLCPGWISLLYIRIAREAPRRGSGRYWLRLTLRAGSFGRSAQPVAGPRSQTEPVPSDPRLCAEREPGRYILPPMKKISREDALEYHPRGRKGTIQVVPT